VFFLFDNGLGGTGKSTFVNVMFELLGDYATTAPMDVFTVATGERHPVELAMLHGARLVTASETEEGRRWDEAKLKQITGGDPITARFMRGNFFTFRPTFKLLLAGNHRPRMRSADLALRRRFHMVPFLTRPAKPDPKLGEKLRAEYPGILSWAIAGELDRRRIGLSPPPSVVAATDEYFEAENVLSRWLDERCSRGQGISTQTGDLYRDYKSWAATAGEFVWSERVFSQKLAQQPGLEKSFHPVTRRSEFRGLSLLAMSDLLSSVTPGRDVRRAGNDDVAALRAEYVEAGEWEADEPS
jgi:putative DNA primase/helicase